MTTTTRTTYEEFADFITSNPTLEQMVDYHLSDHLQERISGLLEANRTRALTAEEQQELDEFIQVEHLMRIIKLHAVEKLENHESGV